MRFSRDHRMEVFGRRLFQQTVFGCLALTVLAGSVAREAVAKGPRVYTNARDVQELSAVEAGRGNPVKIIAVVTYVDERYNDLFIQDETAGIYVFLNESHADAPLHPGQRVTLAGITTAGEFSPCIRKAQIRVIGSGPFPTARRPSIERLIGGREDGHWAEIEGIVRSGQVQSGRLLLNVNVTGGNLVAMMTEYPADWSRTLIDAKVVMRGVIAQLHNNRRQAVGVRILVPAGQIKIEDPAPADPFSIPEHSSSAVRGYTQDRNLEHRVRVRGVVIGREAGTRVYVAGADGNLEVRGDEACFAKPGTRIDAVGFPGSIGDRPALVDATCRMVAGGASVHPIPLTAQQVLMPEDKDPSGSPGHTAAMRHDLGLIRIDGSLLQSYRGPQGQLLLLQSGDRQFLAALPVADRDPGVSLENGARLRLTGVCLVAFDQYRRPDSFQVLLRSPADIDELQSAPWWNLRNALWALGAMGAFLIAAMILMARQSIQLRRANGMLRTLSFQDGLTGVANRRKFDETLAAEVRRASETAAPVSLLMADIDYFKALNDCYGHQRGDECLVEIGRALHLARLGTLDLVARYGGEEFAIILPGSDAEQAVAAAERIRLSILDLAIPNDLSPSNRVVTISVGAATFWPDAGTSAAALISLADRALYRAKTQGRNRTSCLLAEREAVRG